MEYVYSRFESYDFERDDNFQNGTKSLQTSNVSAKALELKLFFYNRFVEPINSEGYKEWRRRLSVTEKLSSFTGDTGQQQLQKSKDESITDSDCSNTGSSTDRTTNAEPLSFAEVMRLIEAGEEIPGLSKLDIKPTNESPTPSQMVRRLKPWEKPPTTK